MSRIQSVSGSITALLVIWCVNEFANAQISKPASPNIVYILADDLGYGDVSCFNSESKIQTPNMDRVAAAGMRFTDAHSNSAVCTPTRYGILTGRYTWRTNLKKGVLNGYSPPLIAPGRMTVASFLKKHGYATACVGKWHLGLGWQLKQGTSGRASEQNVDFAKPVTAGPNTVGFDYSYIIPASLDMDPYMFLENGKVTELPTARIADSPRPAYWRGGLSSPGFKHENCLPELISKAEKWIDERGKDTSAPFFLYLALPAPHTPHVPLPEFRGKSNAGNYGDYVMETEWSMGRIIDALHRNGMDDNTLLILASDNGSHTQPLRLEELYGHHGNYIFRGQKSDAWDGGHHIPFIARWPGKIPAGTTCSQVICLTDLMGTCAAMLSDSLPDNAGEDSFNILPLLMGKTDQPVRDAIVMHSNDGKFAIRQGPWKLVLCRGSGGWTLPENQSPPDAPPMQLYNVEADPRERENLYSDHPEIVRKLQSLLVELENSGRSAPIAK